MLAFVHNLNPIFLKIGSVSIYYYGIIYMTGVFIVYAFLSYLVKIRYFASLGYDILQSHVEDYIFYGTITVVAGSRIAEVIFYDPAYYFSNPLKILYIWEGGLSFHGGLVGLIILTIYWTRKRKIPFFVWIDSIVIPSYAALALGRFANFINGELVGFPVKNQVNPPWYSVKFQDHSNLYRIPSQLIESFVYFILLLLFIAFFRRQFFPDKKSRTESKRFYVSPAGFLSSLFLLSYGVTRFLVEYTKEYYSNIILGLSMGQILNIPMIIFGSYGIYWIYSKQKKRSQWF